MKTKKTSVPPWLVFGCFSFFLGGNRNAHAVINGLYMKVKRDARVAVLGVPAVLSKSKAHFDTLAQTLARLDDWTSDDYIEKREQADKDMTQFGKSFEEMCDFHHCLSNCSEELKAANERSERKDKTERKNYESEFIERGTPETLAAVIALNLEKPLPKSERYKNYFPTAKASSSSAYSSAYRNESNFQKPCAFMSDVSGEGKTCSILFIFYCIDLY